MKAFSYYTRIFLLLVSLQNFAFAGVEPAVSTILDGKYFVDFPGNADYVLNAPFSNAIVDFSISPAPFHFPANQQIRKIDNMLELYLVPHSKDYIDFPFALEVHVKINKAYEHGASNPRTPFATKLKVNYDPAERTKWVEKANFHFENAGKVDYAIDRIILTSNGAQLTAQQKKQLAKIVGLRSDIIVERYYDFDINDRLYRSDFVYTFNTAANEFVVNWNHIAGAELWDLEWAWVDDYDGNGGYIMASQLKLDKHYNLDKNATRVQLSERQYSIPNVYEHGFVLFRVRPVAKVYDGNEIFIVPGKWSNPKANFPDPTVQASNVADWRTMFIVGNAHEGDEKNWQITTNYAEEGKRKDVVNYMDGTFRSRQSIIGLSTNRMTLVEESIYDHQGRGAINVLPAPVKNPSLQYYDKFNQNSSGAAYGRANFDITRSSCDLSADAMNTASGAARYYSPQNPDKTNEKAYIPDAEKFPFAQTEFTPDGTGRIRRQSGVGANHKFGSGHEMEYFYGTMTQEEGAMLFGVEFGEATHYKKNVARDANGQLSVSMLDLKGNVIATALAGTPPDNVDKLKGYRPFPMSIDLMAFSQADILDEALVASRTFTVTTESDYDFSYKVTNDAYRAALCDGKELCLDCVYDLEITLVNNYSCNDVIYQAKEKVGPFQLNSDQQLIIDDTCNGSIVSFDNSDLPSPFKVNLKVGSYTITKKLKVNEQVRDAYVDHYTETFEKECASVYENILADHMSRIDSTDCFLDDDEKAPNRCELARMGMRFDLSPGGQYGLIDFSNYTANDPLSVFNQSNRLSVANAHWKNPTLIFKDLNGNRISHTASTYTLQDFVNDWQADWADQLLPFHPEFCYLDWCENIPPKAGKTSFDFDVELAETQDYNTAMSNGYFSPLNVDPYNFGGRMSPQLSNYNSNSVSMLYLAVQTAWLAEGKLPTSPSSTDINNWIAANATASSDPIADRVWQTFSALYLSKKEFFQFKDRTTYAMNQCANKGGYNECIGADPFNWTLNGFGTGLTSSKFFNSGQTCARQTFQLYKNKVKRFPSAYDLPGNYDPYGNPQDVLDQGGEWTKSITSENCGCLCDADLQELLNGIFKNQRHTGPMGVPLTANYFSTSLQNRINQNGNGALLQSIGLVYVTDGLKIEFFMDDGTVLCPLTIRVANSNYFNWEAVESIDCPEFETAPNGLLIAKTNLYKNGIAMPVTLEVNAACTLFKACEEAGASCPPTATAKELAGLFSLLIANRELDKNVNALPYLSDGLKDYFKSLITQPIARWVGTRNGNQLTATLASPQKTCNFTFDLTAGLNLASLGAILSFTPDNTQINLATGYTKAAILKVAVLNSTSTVEIKVSNSCFEMSYCLKCPPGGLVALPYTGRPIGNQPFQLSPGSQKMSKKELKKLKKELKLSQGRLSRLGNTQTAQAARLPRGAARLHDPNKICDPCEADEFAMTYDSMGVMVSRTPADDICDPCSWSLDSLPSIPIPNPCLEEQVLAAYANAYNDYQRILDSLRLKVRNEYTRHCLGAAEAFSVEYNESMHHFTLYYHDQANNRIQTVPPAGVDLLNQTEIAQAIQYMKYGTGTAITPDHQMETEYTYNSINQLRKQKILDHDGETIFKYDKLSRLVCSQNAEQRQRNHCSYSLYDDLGNTYEAGVLLGVNSLPNTSTMSAAGFSNWTNGFNKREVVRSIYDRQTAAIANQHFDGDLSNYRGRIASVQYYESNAATLTHATHYNYDIQGNIKAIVQDLNQLDAKKMTYHYDLLSGSVHQVNYQPGAIDQFIQKYQYDADNRLVTAESSRDGFVWDTEAEYYYYDHGPLARVEIGEHKVQGTDYVYTIEGWIKGVNSATLNAKYDIGQDGMSGHAHGTIARDVTGYMLRYFTDDYKSIGNGDWEPDYRGGNAHRSNRDLFNGNISSMITAIAPMRNGKKSMGPQAQFFTYDQLQRITSSQVMKGLDANSNRWGTASAITDYATKFSFDANGNLLSLMRNGTTQNSNPLAMDELKYQYITGSNKLDYVRDGVSDGNYDMDIDNQDPGNYTYDRIGNLVRDDAEQTKIAWNVNGKVKSMQTATGKEIQFSYDALGQRVMKVFEDQLTNKKKYTFYIHDANGSLLSTYTTEKSPDPQSIKWQSAYIYGSSRLAEERIDTAMQDLKSLQNKQGQDWYAYRDRGSKYYELTEHRNNVLATVSDRKLAVDDNRDATVDYFEGDLWNVSDYYPYGMQMMERNESFADARFGFQGQEMDDELKGKGNSINYKYRMLDPRLGRFFAVDPLFKEYPELTNYQFSSNRVLDGVEIEGLEVGNYLTGFLLKKMGRPELGNMLMLSDPGSHQLVGIFKHGGVDITIGASAGVGFEGKWGNAVDFSFKAELASASIGVFSGDSKVTLLSANANLKSNFLGAKVNLGATISAVEFDFNYQGGWLREDVDFFKSTNIGNIKLDANIGSFRYSGRGVLGTIDKDSGRLKLAGKDMKFWNNDFNLKYKKELFSDEIDTGASIYGFQATFGLKFGLQVDTDKIMKSFELTSDERDVMIEELKNSGKGKAAAGSTSKAAGAISKKVKN